MNSQIKSTMETLANFGIEQAVFRTRAMPKNEVWRTFAVWMARQVKPVSPAAMYTRDTAAQYALGLCSETTFKQVRDSVLPAPSAEGLAYYSREEFDQYLELIMAISTCHSNPNNACFFTFMWFSLSENYDKKRTTKKFSETLESLLVEEIE